MRLTLPDGTEVETSQRTLDRFWQLSGLTPRTNLEKIKGGHKRRVMRLADELFPKEAVPRSGTVSEGNAFTGEDDNHG